MQDIIEQYKSSLEHLNYCYNYDEDDKVTPSIMIMMGYIDNLIELELLEDDLMELGRS